MKINGKHNFEVTPQVNEVDLVLTNDGRLAGSAPPGNIVPATATTTTGSATDSLVDSMTVTPAAGIYLITFRGSVDHSINGSDITMSLYNDGSRNDASECFVRRGTSQGDVALSFCCEARFTVNGSQAIEGKWKTSGTTASMYARSLSYIKVS